MCNGNLKIGIDSVHVWCPFTLLTCTSCEGLICALSTPKVNHKHSFSMAPTLPICKQSDIQCAMLIAILKIQIVNTIKLIAPIQAPFKCLSSEEHEYAWKLSKANTCAPANTCTISLGLYVCCMYCCKEIASLNNLILPSTKCHKVTRFTSSQVCAAHFWIYLGLQLPEHGNSALYVFVLASLKVDQKFCAGVIKIHSCKYGHPRVSIFT